MQSPAKTEIDTDIASALPPTTEYPAFEYNPPILSPEEDIKAILCTGLSAIPYAGGWLSALVGLLWPVNQPSLWDQISDRVKKIIDEKIESFYQNELKQVIDGLKGDIGDYLKTVMRISDPATPVSDLAQLQEVLRSQAVSLQNQFKSQIPKFTGSSTDSAWKALPFYVHAANLHFGFLADFINRKNAAKYGLNANTTALFHEYWENARTTYAAYVDATLKQASDALEKERADSAGKWEDVRNTNRYSFRDGIATGAWYGQRDFNLKNNQYTLLVRDYRLLWNSQQDPTQPPAGTRPALTRELWYGPYGAPSLSDAGFGQSTWGISHLNPMPFVSAPPVTPQGQRLRYISGGVTDYYREGNNRNRWAFPTQLKLELVGGPVNQLPKPAMGINVEDLKFGGPVVEIDVHVGRYESARSSGGFAKNANTGGYLVSGLKFVQEQDRKALHYLGGNDSYSYEMKEYRIETWTAPAGHVLVNIHSPSRVRRMWTNLGHEGWTSIGSIMFSCCFKDPFLKPTPRLLAMLYVTSPVELTASELARCDADLVGIARTQAEHLESVAAIDHLKGKYFLEDERKLFWSSLE